MTDDVAVSGRARSTTAAGAIALAISAGWSIIGVGIVVDGIRLAGDAGDAESGLVGLTGTALGVVAIFVGTVCVAGATWGAMIGVNVLRRRSWARIAGIATFATYGALAVLYSFLGLSGAVWGLLSAITIGADIAIVGCLAASSTQRDMEAGAPRP